MGIVFASPSIELRIGGIWQDAMLVEGFSARLFEDEGLVELVLPDSFDLEGDAIRIAYRFSTPSTTFSLGLFIAEGSEQVYLNGERLERDRDYSYDLYPFDARTRPHRENRMTALLIDELPGTTFLLLGHGNGLTWAELTAAGDPVVWRHADPTSGLSGPGVVGIARTSDAWWFATRSGLTRLTRSADAFDQATSWSRYHALDDLPRGGLVAVIAWDDENVIAAAPEGLVIGDGSSWRTIPFNGGPITALAKDPFDSDRLYVGTSTGLHVLRLAGPLVIDAKQILAGPSIAGFAVDPHAGAFQTRLWAATDAGVYAVRLSPSTIALPVPGTEEEEVSAVTWLAGEVWYATGTELKRLDQTASLSIAGVITALAPSSPAAGLPRLWVTAASAHTGPIVYKLDAWGMPDDEYSSTETGIEPDVASSFQDPEIPTTAKGSAGEVTATSRLGAADLSAGYRWREPGFSRIGEFNREDAKEWSLSGALPLGKAVVRVSRTSAVERGYIAYDHWDSNPIQTTNDSVEWTWTPGPTLGLAYRSSVRFRGDDIQRRTTYRATSGASLLAERVAVAAYYEKAHRYGDTDTATGSASVMDGTDGTEAAGADLIVRPRTDLTTEFGWDRRHSGEQLYDWKLRWGPTLGATRLSLTVTNEDRRLPGTSAKSETVKRSRREVDVEIIPPEMKVGDSTWTPRLTLAWLASDRSDGEPLRRTRARWDAGASFPGFTSSLTTRLEVEERPRSERRATTGSGAIELNITPQSVWSPSLGVQAESRRLAHPTLGTRWKERVTQTLSLRYRPGGTWANKTALSRTHEREDEKTTSAWKAENTWTWQISAAWELAIEASRSWIAPVDKPGPPFGGSRLVASSRFQVDEHRIGNLRLGWSGGEDDKGTSYQTYTAALDIEYRF